MAKQPKDMDFIAEAKVSGQHFKDTSKRNVITPTGDNIKGPPDGTTDTKAHGPRRWSTCCGTKTGETKFPN
jgi:hypothetical protein